jgi:hypothetical protein
MMDTAKTRNAGHGLPGSWRQTKVLWLGGRQMSINPFYDDDGNRIYSGWETDYFDHIERELEEKEESEEDV